MKLLLILLLFAASAFAAPTPAQKTDALNDIIEDAAAGCRVDVESRLKDPDSAKWPDPWYRNPKFSENGKRLKLQVLARAKNSFGAYSLSIFECDLRKDGNSWRTLRIKENGK